MPNRLKHLTREGHRQLIEDMAVVLIGELVRRSLDIVLKDEKLQ